MDFDVTAPGPRWAMRPGAPQPSQVNHFEPSAADFGRFVLALGRRYTGSYVPAGAAAPLPRVGYWSIWNEPNQPGWLAPQSAPVPAGHADEIEAARLYRGYVDAATASLQRSGHGGDTILIGELAPEGDERAGEASPVPPIPFLKALYCVGDAYAPLRGAAARALGVAAYRLPVFIPQPTFAAGTAVGVWAMLRPAPPGTAAHALIQWRSARGAFRTLAVRRARSADRVLVAAAKPPGSGLIRVVWPGPRGETVASDSVPVTVAAP